MMYAALGSAALGAAGQAGLFGNPSKQYGYSKGDLDAIAAQRASQINDFSSQLASMRSQYLNQIPGLQKAAFNQFGNDAAANFGAKGMETGSGAFQSALAREAIPMQAQMYGNAYSTGVQNLNAVNQARAGLFQGQMGAGSAGMSAPTQNPTWAGLGQFAGQAGLMSMYPWMQPKTPAVQTAQAEQTKPNPTYTPGQGMPLWKD
jgi:hypothetical protein